MYASLLRLRREKRDAFADEEIVDELASEILSYFKFHHTAISITGLPTNLHHSLTQHAQPPALTLWKLVALAIDY